MFRVLLLASLVACGLDSVTIRQLFSAAVTTRQRPRLDGRIVGGRPVNIEDFPYQVSLEYLGSHRCGGSIISPNWVVTVAHCVDGISASNVQFRAGSSFRGSCGILHPAAQLIPHPLYDYLTIDFDVAVARVCVPFTFRPGVQPISMTSREPLAGSLAVVSGWGQLSSGGSFPSQLQTVAVDIIPRAACYIAYANYVGITVNMICARVPEGGKDACYGDSGGPLVVGGKLVGIVSWGIGCALADYPGVYSNVATLKRFVTEQTGVQ